jgi:hypothetical protein
MYLVATERYALIIFVDINKCYLSMNLDVPYRYTLVLTIDILFFIYHYKCPCSQYVLHFLWSG